MCPNAVAQVKVTATVCYPSEEGEGIAGNLIGTSQRIPWHSVMLNLLQSASRVLLLSAVRWTVAGELEPAFARIARQTGEFLLSPEFKSVEFN